jgi:hypothetical protein
LISAEFAPSTVLTAEHDRCLIAPMAQQLLGKIQLAGSKPAGIHDVVRPGQHRVSGLRKMQIAEPTNGTPKAGQVSDGPLIEICIIVEALLSHETIHRGRLNTLTTRLPHNPVIAHRQT